MPKELAETVAFGAPPIAQRPDSFRRWLAEALERQHMTQQALARASGVNQSVISKLLAGKRSRPSHTTVSRIIEALGVSPNTDVKTASLHGTMVSAGQDDDGQCRVELRRANGAGTITIQGLSIEEMQALARLLCSDVTVTFSTTPMSPMGDTQDPTP